MEIDRDLSVCLVMESGLATLRRCLHSLEENSDPVSLEIILVHGSEQVPAAERIACRSAGVKLFENDRPEPLPAQRNHAARISSGRYLLFCSDDIVMQAAGLPNLLRFMDDRPDIGIAGPRVIDGSGAVLPSTRTFPSLATLLLHHSSFGNLLPAAGILRRHLMIEWDHLVSFETDWLLGSFLLVRREVVDDIGLFDEEFATLYAYADLCLRARLAGWRIHYLAEAVVLHDRPEIYGPLLHLKNPPRHLFGDCLRFLLKKWTKPARLLDGSGNR